MASTDIENKNQEHFTTSVDEKTAIKESVPIQEHSHTCNDPTHNHNYPSSVDQNYINPSVLTPTNETSVRRIHKKNKKKQATILAESIPGHRGDQTIDDLVNFINSPSSTNDKQQKKKSTTTTAN